MLTRDTSPDWAWRIVGGRERVWPVARQKMRFGADYIPRAHDAERGRDTIGEFFDRKAVDR